MKIISGVGNGTRKGHCMPVFYELLVRDPELWLRRIYSFIDIPFNKDTLHHQDFVAGRVRLSKYFVSF